MHQYACAPTLATVALTTLAVSATLVARRHKMSKRSSGAVDKRLRSVDSPASISQGGLTKPSEGVCACGADLRGMTSEEVKRHLLSKRHQYNSARLRGRIVVCEAVSEYRAAAQSLVKDGDAVLEVGCHNGGTSAILSGAVGSGHYLGIDHGEVVVAEARLRLPGIRFEVCDAFDVRQLLVLAAEREQDGKAASESRPEPPYFDTVFVDIGGGVQLDLLTRLLDSYTVALKPGLLVVKNHRLKFLLMRSQLWTSIGMPRTPAAGRQAEGWTAPWRYRRRLLTGYKPQ